ncbi:MAG: AAC(3) family N-acetyltransferase [Verrucomicrobia bacterium]|nr:AAC(3) family N-acetyltransferase [Verrucomicrobiota bacterium]MCG2681889.1 AAC(3) family N-acetyltransferase [Kiritimatiellia bacterium]MBU4246729.1 AAC(3) family N-acetyltransferase [Verrucomicrobiota bacterium]MBU4291150.1 AAC(3) family N-acetyltransferase [Verrucomicrobiota bacterium]MBU4429266.1 AAC(3) family N-acetyltransferase [Verrucomicrobiota bacterium]
MYTKNNLKQHLAEMGIQPADTLLVHSSVKKIGETEGRADGILDALMEYLREGLLVFPMLSYAEIKTGNPRFSVRNTPSCVGILSELFRQRPGVFRSLHPTHSVAAFGRDAETFIAGHETFNTPCARESPWGRIVQRNGKILFIGTGIGCNTLLHGVEEWFGVPGMLSVEEQPLEVVTADGRVIPVPSRRHEGNRSRNYAKLEPLFLQHGVMRIVSFGNAKCHLADSRLMANFVTRLLEQDPSLFGHERVPVLNGPCP